MKRILHRRSQPEGPATIGEFDWWWLPAALRAVTLAQGLFIGVAGGIGLIRVTFPLAVLGAIATMLEATGLTRRWVPIIEAGVSGAIVGLAGQASIVGLPYLVVPGFAAGLRYGLTLGLATSVTAGLVFATVYAATGSVTSRTELLTQVVQWGALGATLASLGAWGYRQRQGQPAEDLAYETASRLLEDLHDLTPLLTAGLDSRSIADGMLDDVQEVTSYRQAAVFVPSAHGPRLLTARGATQGWLANLELSDLPEGTNRMIQVPGLSGTFSCSQPGAMAGWLIVQPDRHWNEPTERAVVDVYRSQARRLAAAQAFEAVRDVAAKEERRRIGREIHDGIAQDLASLAYELEVSPSTDREQYFVDRIRELVRDLRLSVFEMREGNMGDVSLADAVSEHASRIAGVADLELRMTVRDSHTPIEPRITYEITKIAREALANVRRHAGARTLWVTVHHDGDFLRVAIADDGRGLDGSQDPTSSGLRIMQERADAIGARLSITGRAGGGTVVIVEHSAEPDRHRRQGAGRPG